MPRPVDRRTVNGLQRRNRGAIAVGLLLALGGGLYGVWGAGEFRSGLTTEIRESRTLSTRDPVARLGLLFAPSLAVLLLPRWHDASMSRLSKPAAPATYP